MNSYHIFDYALNPSNRPPVQATRVDLAARAYASVTYPGQILIKTGATDGNTFYRVMPSEAEFKISLLSSGKPKRRNH